MFKIETVARNISQTHEWMSVNLVFSAWFGLNCPLTQETTEQEKNQAHTERFLLLSIVVSCRFQSKYRLDQYLLFMGGAQGGMMDCDKNLLSTHLFLHVRHCKVNQMGGTVKALSSALSHSLHQLQVKHLDGKIF